MLFFFFNDTATTEIYTLSLHDALPISSSAAATRNSSAPAARTTRWCCGRWNRMGRMWRRSGGEALGVGGPPAAAGAVQDTSTHPAQPQTQRRLLRHENKNPCHGALCDL